MSLSASPLIRMPAKIGAGLLLLWSVLHVYVGVAGAIAFATGSTRDLWTMVIGGANAPVADFVFPTDAVTANAQGHLLLNFCLDVGGFGVVGLFATWLIWARGSWAGYLLALVAVGICDLSFTFALVTSGIIELGVASVAGPVIWILAMIITPFGMPPLRSRGQDGAASSAPKQAEAVQG